MAKPQGWQKSWGLLDVPTKLISRAPIGRPSQTPLRTVEETDIYGLTPGSRIYTQSPPGSANIIGAEITNVGGAWAPDRWGRQVVPSQSPYYALNYNTYNNPQRLFIFSPDGIVSIVRANGTANVVDGIRQFIGTAFYNGFGKMGEVDAMIRRAIQPTLSAPTQFNQNQTPQGVRPGAALDYSKKIVPQGIAATNPQMVRTQGSQESSNQSGLGSTTYHVRTLDEDGAPHSVPSGIAFYGITPGSRIFRGYLQDGQWLPGREVTTPGDWRMVRQLTGLQASAYVVPNRETTASNYVIQSPTGASYHILVDPNAYVWPEGLVLVDGYPESYPVDFYTNGLTGISQYYRTRIIDK